MKHGLLQRRGPTIALLHVACNPNAVRIFTQGKGYNSREFVVILKEVDRWLKAKLCLSNASLETSMVDFSLPYYQGGRSGYD